MLNLIHARSRGLTAEMNMQPGMSRDALFVPGMCASRQAACSSKQRYNSHPCCLAVMLHEGCAPTATSCATSPNLSPHPYLCCHMQTMRPWLRSVGHLSPTKPLKTCSLGGWTQAGAPVRSPGWWRRARTPHMITSHASTSSSRAARARARCGMSRSSRYDLSQTLRCGLSWSLRVSCGVSWSSRCVMLRALCEPA